jgi:Protein phosphatase 2C
VTRIDAATLPAATGRPNEDFFLASPEVAVLLDGAGLPPELGSGCRHGVAWFARRAGNRLFAAASTPERRELAECLRQALAEVAAEHEDCDLSHPNTPSATVIAVRVGEDRLEYLVLCDSTLLLDHADGRVEAITDGRLEELIRRYSADVDVHPAGTPEHAAAFRTFVGRIRHDRNQPGGFWVASARPDAADEAITGSVELSALRGFALLSDGATRPVDLFGLTSWDRLAETLRTDGSTALLAEVREAERSDPKAERWPRNKVYDDATVVQLRFD